MFVTGKFTYVSPENCLFEKEQKSVQAVAFNMF